MFWFLLGPNIIALIKTKNVKLCWWCIIDIIVHVTQQDDLYSKKKNEGF